MSQPCSIDQLDRAIIAALQENGRESFRRIALRLGVAEATVRNRYAKLCASNVLQLTGVTNPPRARLRVAGPCLVAAKASSPTEPIADEISTWKEAGYVVVTAGQFDLLVELICSDRLQLLDLIDRIRAHPVAAAVALKNLEIVKRDASASTSPRRRTASGRRSPASRAPDRRRPARDRLLLRVRARQGQGARETCSGEECEILLRGFLSPRLFERGLMPSSTRSSPCSGTSSLRHGAC